MSKTALNHELPENWTPNFENKVKAAIQSIIDGREPVIPKGKETAEERQLRKKAEALEKNRAEVAEQEELQKRAQHQNVLKKRSQKGATVAAGKKKTDKKKLINVELPAEDGTLEAKRDEQTMLGGAVQACVEADIRIANELSINEQMQENEKDEAERRRPQAERLQMVPEPNDTGFAASANTFEPLLLKTQPLDRFSGHVHKNDSIILSANLHWMSFACCRPREAEAEFPGDFPAQCVEDDAIHFPHAGA